jgi:hypothetical protein
MNTNAVHSSTPRGHLEVKASIPNSKDSVLHNHELCCGPLSAARTLGEEKLEKDKMKNGREVRRQGAAILYLTGLFYIPLNAPGYIRAKPISPTA